MSFRPLSFLRLPAVLTGSLAMLLAQSSLHAQGGPPPPAPTQPQTFDPQDVYYQAYRTIQDAEMRQAEGSPIEAHERLLEARKMIDAIRLYYPDWNPDMVKRRLEKTDESIVAIQPAADKERLENAQKGKAFAEIEGGEKVGGHFIDPTKGAGTPNPDAAQLTPLPTFPSNPVDPIASQELARAEAEVARLKKLLGHTANGTTSNSRTRDLEIQRDQLQAQLNKAQTDLAGLRARLAAGPVQGAFDDLNRKIEDLDQEREAMARALNQSRSLLIDEKARNATLQADLLKAQQEKADIERDASIERDIANSVVAGQREQILQLEEVVKQKDAEIASAHERINGLQKQLDESLAFNRQLQEEHDTLLREKEQMEALLKLNDSGRIQALIEQNMTLGKQLLESEERVKRLADEGNKSQDEYVESLRDLAIAKSQINKLQAERKEQDRRLADLEARLKQEEQQLEQGAISPEEVAILREIIKKQLLVQNRRRQAREELVLAFKERGSDDEAFRKAIELFDGAEIVLSPEEQKLVAQNTADMVLQSPLAPQRSEALRNLNTLAKEAEAYDSLAKKAFSAGRLLSAKELYQMSVDENPGNTAALCKLGFIQMNLNDFPSAIETFRRVTELDMGNPFAHRMLGRSQMELNDPVAAEQALLRAIEVAPEDAISYVLLGTIRYSQNDLAAAESQFRAALAADPSQKDAYYNLAVILSKTGRAEEAKTLYLKALGLGSLPDLELEKKIGLS